MKTPEEIAAEIVGRFHWSSNVMIGGHLVGQQQPVADAIATAIREDREQRVDLEDGGGVFFDEFRRECVVRIQTPGHWRFRFDGKKLMGSRVR